MTLYRFAVAAFDRRQFHGLEARSCEVLIVSHCWKLMSVMYSIVSHVGAAGHGLDACFILSDRGTWDDVLDASVHARAR